MRYTIETNSGELDTYYDYDVSLNYQLNDILDLNSRNTNWSKTIKIPGTPKNNLFFQNSYDVNIDNELAFNPIQRVPAKLKVGDDYVFDGYMQLLNIQETNKDIEYEVSLIGKIGTLFANFGDYTLGQFDLSEYDHIRNTEAIVQSWANHIYSNGELKLAPMGEGYVYPYIKYDEHANNNFLAIDTMYPAFYVRTIVDKMFRAAGFTYTSNFFETELFNRLIIPFNGNKLQLDGNAGVEATQAFYSSTVGITGFTSSNPNLDCEYEGSIFQGSSGGVAKEYVNSWGGKWMYGTAGFNRDTGDLDGTFFSDQAGQMLIGDPLTNWQNGFEIAEDGQYDVDIDMSLAPLITNNRVLNFEDSIIYYKSGNLQYRYQLLLLRTDGTTQEIDSSKNHGGQGTYGIIEFGLVNGVFSYNYYQNGIRGRIYETVDCPVILGATGLNLKKGDKLIIRVGCAMPKSVDFGANPYPQLGNQWNSTHKVTLLPRNKFPYLNVATPYTSTGILKKSDNSVSINAYVSGNQILDNTIKQKDFFLSLVKMFNLVVSDNPYKENDLLIEPYDQWYETKQNIRDWSPKLDEDSLVKITPISDLDFNKYQYTYKEDNDFLNEQYTRESDGLIFGEYSNIVNNPFSNKINKVEPIFSPTPVMEKDGVITPYFTTFDNDEYSPYKPNIRILFWNGMKSSPGMKLYNTFDEYIQDGEFDKFVNNVPIYKSFGKVIDEYPQATMWIDLDNPTDTLEFGRSSKQYFTTSKFAAGTLYEKYHRNLLESIISPNSKLLECEIVLTPKEMAEFDFRDIIFLKEAYWRVNEIKNYNPINSDKTTTVVLYKILGIDLFDKFSVDIPSSNSGCKPYYIQKSGWRTFYINNDGSNPTQDCCTLFGGSIDASGRCYTNTKPPYPPFPPFQPPLTNPFDGPENWTPWTGNFPGLGNLPEINHKPTGGIYTVPIEQAQGPDIFKKNKTKNEGIYVKNNGYGNIIQKQSKNAIIIGNENTLRSTTRNTLIVGNGIIAQNEGSIYLQNAEITKEGVIKPYGYKVIDGGQDTVFPFNKTNPTEIIDGTIDSVRNPGAYSWARPIIDGDGFTEGGTPTIN